MSLWVLGTDTGVGKTVGSALILNRYAVRTRLAYWKPISTGGEEDRDSTTVTRWIDPEVVEVLTEAYLFDPPLSPHLAARLAAIEIDPEKILADLVRHGLEDRQRNLLLEAAGGVLVPLTDRGDLFADLIAETALPAVVVARSTLGTINHTLLTLEALRTRQVPVAGVVLNGPPNPENRRAIERFGKIDVIAEVPPLCDENRTPTKDHIVAAAVKFDPGSILGEYLE